MCFFFFFFFYVNVLFHARNRNWLAFGFMRLCRDCRKRWKCFGFINKLDFVLLSLVQIIIQTLSLSALYQF